MHLSNGEQLLTSEEAGRVLGIGPAGVRYLIRSKRLDAHQIGRIYLVERAALGRIRYGKPGPRPGQGPDVRAQPA